MFQWTKDEVIGLPIILLFIILITFITRIFLKDKSEKVKAYPLQLIAIVLVLLEIIKQVLNIVKGFDTWAIPLHYCSLFVFFFPLAQFGNKKIKSIMKPVAFICAITMTVAFYFGPNLIIGDNAIVDIFNSFGEFHTVIFHHLVILYTTLSIALNNYIPRKDDYKKLIAVMSLYFLIAIPCSYILDTNYCNILESNIPFVKPIREFVGQYLYTFGVYLVVTGGTTLVCYIYNLIYNKITKKESN